MASTSGDSWMKEYNEANKLADDINGMISEKTAMSGSGSESQRHFSAVRRKITILGTRLDSLESLLSRLPSKQSMKDMLSNLRTKTNQMATTLNMSNFANRDSLLGPETKPVDAMTRVSGLDNQSIVEQDEGLEQLEETVISTKHIALTDNLDQHVEFTGSRMQRISKSLAILNKKTKGSCSCLCLLLSVAGIVILILAIFVLIKYL
ncbi:Syntaxin-52 [Bienertia sinuspersici]